MNGSGPVSTLERRKGRLTSRSLLAAFAVLALSLAASCGGASGGRGQQAAGSAAQEAPAKEEQALGREPLGEAGAPVVLTEYADYQ